MKKRLIISFISLLLSSCGEFLSPYSPTEYVPKTVEALKEALVGTVYLRPNSTSDGLFDYHEFMSDNVAVRNEAYIELGNSKSNFDRLKEVYCLNPDMMYNAETLKATIPSLNTWPKYFERILGCNVVFDYIDKVRGTDAQKDAVLAEAYFYRAFFYFNFVNIYGLPYNVAPDSPGVPLKLTSGYEAEYKKRSTVRQVYNQIISDLTEAENCYNRIPLQFQDVTRPSLPLVYLMRSRVALYMENWGEAADYASKLFDSKWKFELYDLNSFKSEESKPYMSYTGLIDVNPETMFLYGNRFTSKYSVSGTIPKMTGPNNTNSGWTRKMFVASGDLMSSFDEEDLRAKNYVVQEYNKNSIPAGPIEGSYCMYGKVNVSTVHDLETSGERDFGMMMRLSEAYLNYAEACVKLNKEGEAIAKLNLLRAKRYKAGSTQSVVPALAGEELLDFVRDERRKELCFEGHRWFDQRRSGKSFIREWYEDGELVHTIAIDENDPALTLPLTPAVLRNNPLLVPNQTWSLKYKL